MRGIYGDVACDSGYSHANNLVMPIFPSTALHRFAVTILPYWLYCLRRCAVYRKIFGATIGDAEVFLYQKNGSGCGYLRW